MTLNSNSPSWVHTAVFFCLLDALLFAKSNVVKMHEPAKFPMSHLYEEYGNHSGDTIELAVVNTKCTEPSFFLTKTRWDVQGLYTERLHSPFLNQLKLLYLCWDQGATHRRARCLTFLHLWQTMGPRGRGLLIFAFSPLIFPTPCWFWVKDATLTDPSNLLRTCCCRVITALFCPCTNKTNTFAIRITVSNK